MNDSNTQWNDLAIIAWNQWKERCSVNKCSEQEQMILSKEIFNAFKRVFIQICPLRYEEILNVNFDIKSAQKINEDEECDGTDTENKKDFSIFS